MKIAQWPTEAGWYRFELIEPSTENRFVVLPVHSKGEPDLTPERAARQAEEEFRWQLSAPGSLRDENGVAVAVGRYTPRGRVVRIDLEHETYETEPWVRRCER